MNELAFLGYRYRNSIMHKINSTLKLVLFLALTISIFFVNKLFWFLPLLALTTLLIVFSKFSLKILFKHLKLIVWIVVFSFVFNLFFYSGDAKTVLIDFFGIKLFSEALIFSTVIALKLLFLTIIPAIYTFSTPPMQLAKAIENILFPLKVFGVRTEIIGLAISIVIRYIEILFNKISLNLLIAKYRGINSNNKKFFTKIKIVCNVIFSVFVSSLIMADDLAESIFTRDKF